MHPSQDMCWGLAILKTIMKYLVSFLAIVLTFGKGQSCSPEVTKSIFVPPKQYHYVFVVDTSGSMMGLGDGKGRVVFPRVKEEIKKFVAQVPPESRVTIQPFDAGLGSGFTASLPAGKEAINAYLNNLQARGSQTHVYAALTKVLQDLENKRRPEEAYTVYVFTDGKDNDPGPLTIDDVTRRYKLKRGPYDWLFYISLGIPTPEEVRKSLSSAPNTRTLDAAPNQVPTLTEITLRPGSLELGNLWEKPSAQREILLQTQGTPQSVGLEVVAPELEKQGAFLEVNPRSLPARGTAQVTFNLRNPESLPHGQHSAWLCLKAGPTTVIRPQAAQVRFSYHPPGEYALEPAQVPSSLQLARGEDATLRYHLEGNAWAKEPAEVRVNAPEGLEVFVNGQKGSARVSPGQNVELKLVNQGLSAGVTQTPGLEVVVPPGSQAKAPSSLPPVTQPMTLWDWLMRLWWLALLLLLLLFGLLWLWWRSQQPWGKAHYIASPKKGCQEKEVPLKKTADLGQLVGEEGLEGVRLRKEANTPFLVDLPVDVTAESNGIHIKPNSRLEWGEKITFRNLAGEELGSVELQKR